MGHDCNFLRGYSHGNHQVGVVMPSTNTETCVRRLKHLRIATARRRAQLEGWPDIPDPDKRESYLKRKMKKRRYDDPGQIVRLKGDRR
jgi:hypothetical protein